MIITRLQWADPAGSGIIANNGEMFIPWPCFTWHGRKVQEYLSSGGVILAAKPSEDSVFTGVDSVDPAVMYRDKNEIELSAEKDAASLEMRDVKLVAEAVLEAVHDMKQNPGNYTAVGSLKQKALQQYRSKL